MLAVFLPPLIQVGVDNKTTTDIVSPFIVSNSTQFTPVPAGSNSQLLRPLGQSNVIIAINARSYIPTIIDS